MILEDSSLLIYGTTQSDGNALSESSKFHHNTKLPNDPVFLLYSFLALLREYYVLNAQNRAYSFTDKCIKQYLKRHFRKCRKLILILFYTWCYLCKALEYLITTSSLITSQSIKSAVWRVRRPAREHSLG